MTLAVDIALPRISSAREEGFKPYPYDDATGLRVRAPKGNITIGYGFNMDAERPKSFWLNELRDALSVIDAQLMKFVWYQTANSARQSVFIDIAFNLGIDGLLHFPSMIHYAGMGDWVNASKQCSVKPDEPPGVIARYKRLADILLSGVDSNAT